MPINMHMHIEEDIMIHPMTRKSLAFLLLFVVSMILSGCLGGAWAQ